MQRKEWLEKWVMSLVSTYASGEIKAELLGNSCQHVAGVWERDWAGDLIWGCSSWVRSRLKGPADNHSLFPRSPLARWHFQAQASLLGLWVQGIKIYKGSKERKGGICWVEEIAKEERAGGLEAKAAVGERNSGGRGSEAKTRSELDVFMRFGEERLSSPLPHFSLWCVNLYFLP